MSMTAHLLFQQKTQLIAGNEYQPPALPGKEIRERTGHGTRTVQMLGGGATLTTHRAT